MDWQLMSQYAVAVMMLPVLFYVGKNVYQNRVALFDDDLTAADRTLLKQAALFLILPLVALFHELGHALAAKIFHVEIIGFHWSLFWGQVDTADNLAPYQSFIIALAGNLFQLIATLLFLAVAWFSRSPAVVALLTYSYLLSGSSGLVFYPILSLAGWNYDFAIIYGSEERHLALLVGILHIVLAGLFAWTFLSQKSRLWFARKTRPAWSKEYDKVVARVKADPSAVNLLSQAWQFYFVGLEKSAEEALDRVEDADKSLMEVWLLRGYLQQSRGKYNSAVHCFDQITKNPDQDKTLLARAWMARGHCLSEQLEDEGGKKDYEPVLMSYKEACKADTLMADPHYYLAVTLTKAGNFKEAEGELDLCQNYAKRGLSWIDPILAGFIREAVNELRQSAKPKP